MELYRRLCDMLEKGKESVLVTVIDSFDPGTVGAKLLKNEEGTHITEKMQGPERKFAGALAEKALEEGVSHLFEKEILPGKKVKFFVEIVAPAPEAVIFGAGHISQETAFILDRLGFSVTVIDDRPEFANRERFPRAKKIICQPFAEALKTLAIGCNSYVIIMTRGHAHDYNCLAGVLNSDAAYIGMIGSRRKVKMHKERLAEEGFDKEKITSVYAPIGLDIEAETPGEIAVSIAAQLIAVKNRRKERAAFNSQANEKIYKILAKGSTQGVLATIIAKEGSGPRECGTKILVSADGKLVGTVGGGLLEARVIKEASSVLKEGKAKIISVDMTNDDAKKAGMICGGTARIFLEKV